MFTLLTYWRRDSRFFSLPARICTPADSVSTADAARGDSMTVAAAALAVAVAVTVAAVAVAAVAGTAVAPVAERGKAGNASVVAAECCETAAAAERRQNSDVRAPLTP